MHSRDWALSIKKTGEIRLIWNGDRFVDSHTKSTPTHKPFLKGPIPLYWLRAASELPNRALAVGILMWYLRGLEKSPKDLVLTNKRAALFGLSRYTKGRALRELENAGLVIVRRRPGQCPRVTIIQE